MWLMKRWCDLIAGQAKAQKNIRLNATHTVLRMKKNKHFMRKRKIVGKNGRLERIG